MPTNKPLSNLNCQCLSRTWMKRSKAWRVRLLLPDDAVLAAVLSNMMESQVDAVLQGNDAPVTIAPAFIGDVVQKGTRWHLELETVSESQNGVGAQLTLLSGQPVVLSLHPVGQAPVEPVRGDVSKKTLQGLHVSLFPSPLFQAFLAQLTGAPTDGANECKAAFKEYLGVTSCRELQQEQVCNVIDQFNAHLRGERPWQEPPAVPS